METITGSSHLMTVPVILDEETQFLPIKQHKMLILWVKEKACPEVADRGDYFLNNK